MWKCNKCNNVFGAMPGLVRNTVLHDGTIESAQPCNCGGWRIFTPANTTSTGRAYCVRCEQLTIENGICLECDVPETARH